jgi:hypothetical protein
MIVKLTLFGLVLVLIGVIALSYYTNKEGFDDISNSYLSGISNDMSSAVNTVSSGASSAANSAASMLGEGSPPDSIVPKRTDVVPQVSISGSGYNAMSLQEKADLLKDIQKLVRNEVLAHRATTPIISGETEHKKTDSTAQGQDYENSCSKDTDYRCPKNPDGSCPPLPDMTQYIKKDAIPCYGCSLDY